MWHRARECVLGFWLRWRSCRGLCPALLSYFSLTVPLCLGMARRALPVCQSLKRMSSAGRWRCWGYLQTLGTCWRLPYLCPGRCSQNPARCSGRNGSGRGPWAYWDIWIFSSSTSRCNAPHLWTQKVIDDQLDKQQKTNGGKVKQLQFIMKSQFSCHGLCVKDRKLRYILKNKCISLPLRAPPALTGSTEKIHFIALTTH